MGFLSMYVGTSATKVKKLEEETSEKAYQNTKPPAR